MGLAPARLRRVSSYVRELGAAAVGHVAPADDQASINEAAALGTRNPHATVVHAETQPGAPPALGRRPLRGRRGQKVAGHVQALYDRFVIDDLRAAVEALNDGDVEPFLALIDENSEWLGIARGHLWWKHAPSCRGPDEAREVLQFQRRKRGSRQVQIDPEFLQVGDKIIGSAPWGEPGDRLAKRFMVFTIRDHRIVDMQGFASRRGAERFATRR